MVREGESKHDIIKWKHDLETNVLEVEMARACSMSSIYILSLNIAYKNYGIIQTYETYEAANERNGLKQKQT